MLPGAQESRATATESIVVVVVFKDDNDSLYHEENDHLTGLIIATSHIVEKVGWEILAWLPPQSKHGIPLGSVPATNQLRGSKTRQWRCNNSVVDLTEIRGFAEAFR